MTYQVEFITLKKWQEGDYALILGEDEDWILTGHFVNEYLLDGFKLHKKAFIEGRRQGEDTKLIERVLNLKQRAMNPPDEFQFRNTIDQLRWCEKQFGLFEFQCSDERELYFGILNAFDKENFTIDFIDTNGELKRNPDYAFQIEEVRIITFLTDYHQSMCLLYHDQNF